jgi:multidrug resistance protein, MATE family
MLGIYLQSSFIISTLFCIIISIFWFFSEEILILLHQQPEVSHMAGLYLKCLIPGLFAYGYLQCILRFLQTQTVVMPLVVCSLIPLLAHILITYLLVHVFELGFVGTSISGSVSLCISCLMLAGYVKYSKDFKNTWEGFSMEAFKHVLPSMKLAAPSAIMVWLVLVCVCVCYCSVWCIIIGSSDILFQFEKRVLLVWIDWHTFVQD